MKTRQRREFGICLESSIRRAEGEVWTQPIGF